VLQIHVESGTAITYRTVARHSKFVCAEQAKLVRVDIGLPVIWQPKEIFYRTATYGLR
jgi:hypothetical protein